MKFICIWNEAQRTPATVYGKANCPQGFEVVVCKDAAAERDAIQAKGMDAIIYHFNGAGSSAPAV